MRTLWNALYFITEFNCEAWRDRVTLQPATFYHISTFSFRFHFNFFFFSLELRNSFVPLICFHFAAPLGNGLPLMQLNSFIWIEPLAHQTPRFATLSHNLQHWFLKRSSPASTKQGTARLFLPSTYDLQGQRIKSI